MALRRWRAGALRCATSRRLELARDGIVDAVTFTPFNKQAMRMARPSYDDEVGVITEVLRAESHGREFNEMQAAGVLATEPIRADTVFVRARKGEFDAVPTMYHDQGQIAMKLMGFDQGVTLLGGYAMPICTPAHRTAYDIAGRIADAQASRNAVLLAAQMAGRKQLVH